MQMPFENSLALRVVRKHRDGVTVHCPIREDYMNSQGVLHGGLIASVADEAAWHALIHAYKGDRNATTTELKVNYLRPIVGSKVVARAYVLRAGKLLCLLCVDLFDTEKRLSAVGLVTYMLLPQ